MIDYIITINCNHIFMMSLRHDLLSWACYGFYGTVLGGMCWCMNGVWYVDTLQEVAVLYEHTTTCSLDKVLVMWANGG